MRDKRGQGLAIEKLIGIVLVLIVFLLILFVPRAVQGSIETMDSKIGDVGLFLNSLTGESYDGSCDSNPINSISEGAEFLDSIEVFGIDHSNSIAKVCKGFECTLELMDVEDYRLSQGEFFRQDSKVWNSNNWFIEDESIERSRAHHEIYHATLELLDGNGLRNDYEGLVSGEFIFRGVREPEFIYNEWGTFVAHYKKGEWTVLRADIVNYYGIDSKEALSKFYSLVDQEVDADVYFAYSENGFSDFESYSDLEMKRIDELTDFLDSEIDSKEEFGLLVGLFEGVNGEFIENGKLSEEEKNKFLAVNGKTVNSLGESYDIEVSFEDDYPLIKLSGPETYSLKFDSSARQYSEFEEYSNGEKGYRDYNLGRGQYPELKHSELISKTRGEFKLRYSPFIFVDSSGNEVGDSNTYKLPKNVYPSVYRGTLSHKFLVEKCG